MSLTLDEQIDSVPGVVHRSGHPYDTLGDQIFFPVNHRQVRDLIGRLLTQLDAMALPDRAHRAAKTLLVQEVWRWWGDACDNACTSGAGCLAPIVMDPEARIAASGKPLMPPSNRWGWQSEEAWLDSPHADRTVDAHAKRAWAAAAAEREA